MSSFSIVEFSEEKTVEVVPSNWIVNDSYCYWPSIKGPQLTKMLRGKDQPCKKNLTLYSARRVGEKTFETYVDARKHLDEAENTSSLETESESELIKSRKDRKRKLSCDGFLNDFHKSALNVNDEEDSVSLLENRSVEQENSPVINSLRFSSEEADSVSFFNIPSTSSRAVETKKHRSAEVKSACTCQEKVLEEIQKIRNEQLRFQEIVIKRLVKIDQNVDEALKNIINVGMKNSAPAVVDLPTMPITSFNELKVIENWLTVDENGQILTQHLSSVGGASIKDTTRRILSRMLKGEICWGINWTGKNGKFAFMKTCLAKIIISAVQLSQPASTEKEVEDAIKSWFRFSKDRDGGRVKRGTNENRNEST